MKPTNETLGHYNSARYQSYCASWFAAHGRWKLAQESATNATNAWRLVEWEAQ